MSALPVYRTNKFFLPALEIGKSVLWGFRISDVLHPNITSVFRSEAFIKHFYQDLSTFVFVKKIYRKININDNANYAKLR